MSWEIKYTDKWSGKETVHKHTHTEGDAMGWAKNLAAENNCKAECVRIADGPYDHSGKVTHVASFGDKQ